MLGNLTASWGPKFATVFTSSLERVAIEAEAILPNLFVAIIIFLGGYFVSVLVSWIAKLVLRLVRLESFLRRHRIDKALGTIPISRILVKLTKYYVILVFFNIAVSKLKLGIITLFFDAVLAYTPIIMSSAFLAVTAALVGELVKQKIFELDGGAPSVNALGRVSKALVIFVGAIVALSTLGFKTEIATQTFMTLLQGIIFGMALAAGIALGLAFGLGGRKHAEDVISSARKRFEDLFGMGDGKVKKSSSASRHKRVRKQK